jgi:hypothetical protein
VKIIRLLVKRVQWLYRNKWGLCLTLLVVAGLLSIDWGGVQDDLPPRMRVHMEDCASAQRALGADFLRERPDCAKYVVHLPTSATRH